MSNCKEQLFTEFKAPTRQEWLDKIQVDLKGADFNKRLRSEEHTSELQSRI